MGMPPDLRTPARDCRRNNPGLGLGNKYFSNVAAEINVSHDFRLPILSQSHNIYIAKYPYPSSITTKDKDFETEVIFTPLFEQPVKTSNIGSNCKMASGNNRKV